jgi:hypothetical protein
MDAASAMVMTHMLSEFAIGTFLNAPPICVIQTLHDMQTKKRQPGFGPPQSGRFYRRGRRYRKEFCATPALSLPEGRVELNRIGKALYRRQLAKPGGSL